MSWHGAGLAKDIIDSVHKHVPDATVRAAIYADLIAAFEDHDCSTLYEIQEFNPDIDPAWVAAFDNHNDFDD